MTRPDLDAIRARVNAATPGVWEASGFDNSIEIQGTEGWSYDESRKAVAENVYLTGDREFIAHARTDIPALIAEVERLRTYSEEMETAYRERTAEVGKLRASVSMLEAKVVTEIGNRKRVEGELRLVRLLPPSQVQAAQVIRDLKAQTIRVREMHRSMMPDAELHPHLVFCAICTDEMGDHRVYPCPTIKALEGDGE